ncbi:MAG: (4Fe-4S)-binding protein [Bacteroidota bacterium]
MGKVTKKYTNGEITVVWKPDLCVHATNCFTELPKVFIPYERPWIRMNEALTNEIITTVNSCPTDALTFYWNNEGPKDQQKAGQSTTEISIIKNGPYIVKGAFKITDTDGNEIETQSTASLCRCGYTKKRPFCDGSHVDSDFKIDEGSDY